MVMVFARTSSEIPYAGNTSYFCLLYDMIEEILFEGYTDEKREEVVKEIATNKELQKRMIEFKMPERENKNE